MKIKVVEIGYGICKDENEIKYVGIEDENVMNLETGEIYQISQRDENENVIEISDDDWQ